MIDREEHIRALLPLVRRIARRIAAVVGGTDLDDLIGDGSIGLIRAVDSFDPQYGVTLDQYARRVIAGAMLNGIRRLDPVSERVRRTVRDADRERYALASERGALPSIAEMETRIPTLKRARTEAYRGSPVSIDAPLPNRDRIEIATDDDPSEAAIAVNECERLHRAVAMLPKRERRVILAHYFTDRSLRTLSRELEISPQRVSQVHLLAIARLRAQLAAPA